MYAITQTTCIDDRTIRRLDAEVPDADTQDRTDGRVGWSYYGLADSEHAEAWTWTVYNGDPEAHDEATLMEMGPESEMGCHLLRIADEIEDWDAFQAQWIRDTLGTQYVAD